MPCPADGWTPPPAAADVDAPSPPRVAGFRLGERIGKGGFADVWGARRDEGGAPAAIKVARAATPLSRERFRRETDALARIGAPHAPELHGHGEIEAGRPYIVMERLFGGTLAAELGELVAPPDADRVVRRARTILAALEAIHARGLIHRDLKPENIFLPHASERAVLIDFGLVKRLGTANEPEEQPLQTRAGAIIGTPEYMAPEQIQGEPRIDSRADIYAFGVILYELLTLRPPFVGDESTIHHGHLALRPPRPVDLAPLPAALAEIALACLAKDPRRRPAGAAELLRAMEVARMDTLAHQEPRATRVDSGRPPSPSPPDSARLIADGHHPVALLVAEVGGAASPVITAITDRKGFVARQRGRRYVAVFTSRDVGDPAHVALGAARHLVDRHDARAALHIVRVLIRPSVLGSPAIYGAPVDRPDTWLPPEPWSGLVFTEEFERALPDDAVIPAPDTGGGEEGDLEAPLLGRDGDVATLTASAAAAFDGTCPGMLTVIGEVGLGKTRLAAEAARVAASLDPDAAVLSLRAQRSIHGGAAHTVRALLARALDAPAEAPPDTRAFCAQRLGDALGARVWSAVEIAMGWSAAATAGGAGAPAIRRLHVLEAITEGLRGAARRGPIAVILDDAEQADDVALDALECATLDGEGVRLWVVITAGPRFEQVRRGWGLRSQRHDKVTLSALGEAPAMELAARLLLPAEYPPADMLRRLAGWAGGNPGCLREIVRSFKKAGALRPRRGGGWYVATAAIDAMPPSPTWQWLAMRQLDDLPPELAACVRVCAVLGVSFGATELEQVLEGIERAGGAGTPIDASFGLAVLVEQGILQRGGERCAFQSAVLQYAIYDMLDPAHREQIHRHALTHWRAQAESAGAGDAGDFHEALESRARHAAACGEREEAADAYLTLGDLASAKHRHVEADQRYTAALGVIAEDDAARRARALMKRGKSRIHRGYLVNAARADFAEALTLAGALGDARIEAKLLLEDATALDWSRDFDESARRVEEARRIIEGQGFVDLAVPLQIADGRTAWRQGQMERSLELLERGAEAAAAIGDYESRVIALVMLSFELACVGSLEKAEARFDEVIALAMAAGDLLHLCTAYSNRFALWASRWSLPGAVDDMRRSINVAREIGNPYLEYIPSYNMAVLLYWSGRLPEALVLVQRAQLLEERFLERPVCHAGLMRAEILLLLDDYQEAARWIAWVERLGPPEPPQRPCFHALQLVLSEMGVIEARPSLPTWDDVVRLEADNRSTEGMLVVLHWRARMALRAGRRAEAAQTLEAARACRKGSPMWQSRFEAMAAEILEPGPIALRDHAHDGTERIPG